MTRWQGIELSRQLRMILPTARWARGLPAAAATSPYVATRPRGIFRTADRTRALNPAVFERPVFGLTVFKVTQSSVDSRQSTVISRQSAVINRQSAARWTLRT